MNNRLRLMVSLSLISLGSTVLGTENQKVFAWHGQEKNAKIAALIHDNLDDTVRHYLKVVKHANTIEDLAEFLPAFRLKKFRTDYTQKQKDDWLRYRKQMPKIGPLVGKEVTKDRAILRYETTESSHRHHRKKQRTVAEITLVKERGKWKVFLEHFGPENEKNWHRTSTTR